MIKKQFLYCEDTEGGMSTSIFEQSTFLPLYGWMQHGCKRDDTKLLRWMETAEIGDYYNHRLGTIIRIKDK